VAEDTDKDKVEVLTLMLEAVVREFKSGHFMHLDEGTTYLPTAKEIRDTSRWITMLETVLAETATEDTPETAQETQEALLKAFGEVWGYTAYSRDVAGSESLAAVFIGNRDSIDRELERWAENHPALSFRVEQERIV